MRLAKIQTQFIIIGILILLGIVALNKGFQFAVLFDVLPAGAKLVSDYAQYDIVSNPAGTGILQDVAISCSAADYCEYRTVNMNRDQRSYLGILAKGKTQIIGVSGDCCYLAIEQRLYNIPMPQPSPVIQPPPSPVIQPSPIIIPPSSPVILPPLEQIIKQPALNQNILWIIGGLTIVMVVLIMLRKKQFKN